MKNRKGFTLIELVITLAILGIVVPMIFSPIIFSLNNFNSQNEKAEITSDARAAMDYLTREIRKSKVGAIIIVAQNTIKIDSSLYKKEGRDLIKLQEDTGDKIKIVSEGVDELLISEEGEKIRIEIGIKDSKGDTHRLSSDIYMR